MQIIPMRDLKDTVKIEKLCNTTKSPVFVTKNGYGKLVVMDIECFEKLIEKAYEAKIVNEGLSDLKEGKLDDGKAIIDIIGKKYGF